MMIYPVWMQGNTIIMSLNYQTTKWQMMNNPPNKNNQKPTTTMMMMRKVKTPDRPFVVHCTKYCFVLFLVEHQTWGVVSYQQWSGGGGGGGNICFLLTKKKPNSESLKLITTGRRWIVNWIFFWNSFYQRMTELSSGINFNE